jgi:sodium transport system permease protein
MMASGIRLTRVLRILAKEIREARRDRNLVIQVVLVPLFLYPVLGFAFFQVWLVMQGMAERESTRIAVGANVPEEVVRAVEARDGVQVLEAPPAWSAGPAPSAAAFRAERAAAEREGRPVPQAALLWRGAAGADSAVIFHDRSRERSEHARSELEEVLGDRRRERVLTAMSAVGLGETDLDVWTVEEENTASAEQRGQELLSLALPLVLLLMLAQGTFYSALDAMVGERERGTFETLLTAPLVRGEVMLGKFLYVVLASVVALLLNLASLTIFFGFLTNLMGAGEEIRVVVGPQAVLLIVVAATLTAGLLAAVFLVVAAPARTYREGQATLTPIYLLLMVPGMIVVFDRSPFGLGQATVPLLNAAALFKSVLRGETPAVPIAVTLAVLAAVTAAALAAAARLMTREGVYLDPRMTLRRLLTGRGGRSA